MAPPSRSSSPVAIALGLVLATALVGGAVLAGRLPRESSEYPGVVLDPLPRGRFDGPTQRAEDAERGLTVQIPEDASCSRDATDLFICRYPRLDLAVAWHVDALLDERDVREDLLAARRRQLDRTREGNGGGGAVGNRLTHEHIVRIADTTGILTEKRCDKPQDPPCRNELRFIGWYGSGPQKVRLHVEAGYGSDHGPEVALAMVQSTRFVPPAWQSLRPEGKSPAIRPEARLELQVRGHSRNGRVTLSAPMGSTCRAMEQGVRCDGRAGWFASISALNAPRPDDDAYPSAAEWLRREAAQYRAAGKPAPGEPYVLSSIAGFARIEDCAKPPSGVGPCRHRVLIHGVPVRDSVSVLVTAEISVTRVQDLDVGWAALDAAEILGPSLR